MASAPELVECYWPKFKKKLLATSPLSLDLNKLFTETYYNPVKLQVTITFGKINFMPMMKSRTGFFMKFLLYYNW